MHLRGRGLQFWALLSLVWTLGVGVMVASAYAGECFADQVRLQQQAKDIRAAGLDPATVEWGGPIQAGGFIVPPVHLKAPLFWRVQGGHFIGLGLSLPLAALLILEMLARAVSTARAGLRRLAAPRPAREPVLPGALAQA